MTLSSKEDFTNELIDRLVKEYKEMLIKKTLVESNQFDLIGVDYKLLIKNDYLAKKALKPRSRFFMKSKKIINESLIFGIIYILLGIFVLLTSDEHVPSILFLIFGAVLSIISLVVSYRNSKEVHSFQSSKINIIYQWNEIELLLLHLSSDRHQPISDTIKSLNAKGILTKKDASDILDILHFRNKLVHENKKSINSKELSNISTLATLIINKLENYHA